MLKLRPVVVDILIPGCHMSIRFKPFAIMLTLTLIAMIALPSYSLAATYAVPGNYPDHRCGHR